jgi:hypothetical protein
MGDLEPRLLKHVLEGPRRASAITDLQIFLDLPILQEKLYDFEHLPVCRFVNFFVMRKSQLECAYPCIPQAPNVDLVTIRTLTPDFRCQCVFRTNECVDAFYFLCNNAYLFVSHCTSLLPITNTNYVGIK